MTNDRAREYIEAGERAKALLDDPTLQEVFERLDAKFVDAWRNCRPDDQEGREKLYWAMQGLEYVRRELRIMLDNGKVAASELGKQQER